MTRLSDRERRVLRLLADGHTQKEIATLIHLSGASVKDINKAIRHKLGARNTCHAVLLAVREGEL